MFLGYIHALSKCKYTIPAMLVTFIIFSLINSELFEYLYYCYDLLVLMQP